RHENSLRATAAHAGQHGRRRLVVGRSAHREVAVAVLTGLDPGQLLSGLVTALDAGRGARLDGRRLALAHEPRARLGDRVAVAQRLGEPGVEAEVVAHAHEDQPAAALGHT